MEDSVKRDLSTPCVHCGCAQFALLYEAKDFDTGTKPYDIERCTKCGLVRTAPTLDKFALREYYKLHYYGSTTTKFSKLIEWVTAHTNSKLAKAIMAHFTDDSSSHAGSTRVLDIGCGRANLLKALATMGCECHGLERPDFPGSIDTKNIRIHKSEMRETNFESDYFDIVILWHVLEHLTNPPQTLLEIKRVLRPNGSLIITVPNFGSLQARIFGKYWFHLDLPRHLFHFDDQSLKMLLSKQGFKFNKFSIASADQALFGFIQSALNYCSPLPPNVFYDKLKKNSDKNTTFYVQLIASSLFSPLAILDYLIAHLLRNPCCITVAASK